MKRKHEVLTTLADIAAEKVTDILRTRHCDAPLRHSLNEVLQQDLAAVVRADQAKRLGHQLVEASKAAVDRRRGEP